MTLTSEIIHTLNGVNHKVFDICIQGRFKSVCATLPSDQSLSFPPEETLNPWLAIEYLGSDGAESLMGAHAILYLLMDTNLYVPALVIFVIIAYAPQI